MTTKNLPLRSVKQVFTAQDAMDGDGVKLTRHDLFSGVLDPFIMLDEFKAPANQPPNGFPRHPHRGIQTLSYLIDGAMAHADSLGTESTVTAGGLQWMNSGQGIEHLEQPQIDENGLWGYQFWLHIPKAEKYQPPSYQAVAAEQTLALKLPGLGGQLLAGDWQIENEAYECPFQKLAGNGALADFTWKEDRTLKIQTREATLAVRAIVGEVSIVNQTLGAGQLAVLDKGEALALTAKAGSRVLVFKGTPIGEPIVQKGPFVMNTQEEVLETIQAYQSGRLIENNQLD